jgi:hypothetical protein
MVLHLTEWFDQPMSLEDERHTIRLQHAGRPRVEQPRSAPIRGFIQRTLQAFAPNGKIDKTLLAYVYERGGVRQLLFFELINLAWAILAILSPPVVMHADGLWITGRVVEVTHQGGSNWMTIEDPRTEFRFDAPSSSGQSIGEVVTVVVHPTDRTNVRLPTSAYVYAQGVLLTTVLPLAWPVAWWADRRRRHRPGLAPVFNTGSGLSVASLAAILVILVAPPMDPGVDRPEAFFGNLWLATVPLSLAVAALALNRSWRRPDWSWATAMTAIGLTLAGFALWIAEHV